MNHYIGQCISTTTGYIVKLIIAENQQQVEEIFDDYLTKNGHAVQPQWHGSEFTVSVVEPIGGI